MPGANTRSGHKLAPTQKQRDKLNEVAAAAQRKKATTQKKANTATRKAQSQRRLAEVTNTHQPQQQHATTAVNADHAAILQRLEQLEREKAAAEKENADLTARNTALTQSNQDLNNTNQQLQARTAPPTAPGAPSNANPEVSDGSVPFVRGRYKLQEKMGLSDNYELFKNIETTIHECAGSARPALDFGLTFGQNEALLKGQICAAAREQQPYLRRFAQNWAAIALLRQYHKNARDYRKNKNSTKRKSAQHRKATIKRRNGGGDITDNDDDEDEDEDETISNPGSGGGGNSDDETDTERNGDDENPSAEANNHDGDGFEWGDWGGVDDGDTNIPNNTGGSGEAGGANGSEEQDDLYVPA